MKTTTKVLLIVGGLALAGTAGYFIYNGIKKKKEEAEAAEIAEQIKANTPKLDPAIISKPVITDKTRGTLPNQNQRGPTNTQVETAKNTTTTR